MASLWRELRRRNVVKVGMAYLAAAWLVLQVVSIVFPAFRAPDNLMPVLIVVIALGFPVALVLAWVFELTPEGVRRADDLPQTGPALRTGRKLDFVIIGLLATALSVIVVDQYVLDVVPSPTVRSIAVLPLANYSGDAGQDYFVDGMTEALIASLARLETLRVISRTSAMQYKQTTMSLPEIAAALGVDAVIEGSAARVGNRVRITAQLIDADDDTHLWAGSYESELENVLRMQNEIAGSIAREVQLELTPEQASRLERARPVKPESYEAYLRGMYHLYQFTEDGFERGLRYLQQAIDSDPADPLAYAGLAHIYSIAYSHSPAPPPDAFMQRAAAAIETALTLDDTLAEAYAALGQVRLYQEWDWSGAEQAFRQALELNPNLAPAHGHYAMYLDLVGRREEALAAMERAEAVDPLAPVWITWQGDLHWDFEQYDEAIVDLERSLDLDPEYTWTWFMLGLCYDGKELYEEAIAAHEKATALNAGFGWALAYSYALAGRRAEARDRAATLAQAPRPYAWGLAHIHVALGDEDEAFRWLEIAYRERYAFMPWVDKVPTFESLHGDPRMADLVRRLNLPRQNGAGS